MLTWKLNSSTILAGTLILLLSNTAIYGQGYYPQPRHPQPGMVPPGYYPYSRPNPGYYHHPQMPVPHPGMVNSQPVQYYRGNPYQANYYSRMQRHNAHYPSEFSQNNYPLPRALPSHPNGPNEISIVPNQPDSVPDIKIPEPKEMPKIPEDNKEESDAKGETHEMGEYCPLEIYEPPMLEGPELCEDHCPPPPKKTPIFFDNCSPNMFGNPLFGNVRGNPNNLLNPGGGGNVGRIKVATDNNPLARDRIFLNYDYLDTVPIASDAKDIHRYVAGFEKSFLNGWTSFQVRVPFANTLDTDQMIGGGGDNVELGNVHLNSKVMFLRHQTINAALGLGTSIPTAGDARLFAADGTELAKIENETFFLTPYVAWSWTPSPRFFHQTWLSWDFEIDGNSAFARNQNGVLVPVGDLNNQILMEVDSQIGYWVYKSMGPFGFLQGLAPFFEVHYAYALNDADAITANGLVLGNVGDDFKELNLAAGLVIRLWNTVDVTLGGALPVFNDPDRLFDWQAGGRVNIFFGPTAAGRGLYPY